MQISRSRDYLTLNISETVSDKDIVTMKCYTYTRTTERCHFEWPRVTLSDLTKYSMTENTRGLSATAELLVLTSVQKLW